MTHDRLDGDPPGWRVHLPSGMDPADLDLTAAGSLPRAWTRRWSSHPGTPTLFDRSHGWITAEQLEERSRTVAGRLLHAGVAPGERMLFSAATSIELAIAHVAALRAGIVVVPVNTAYREREIAHVVGEVAPVAALVDDDERRDLVREAAERHGQPITVVGPAIDLPDRDLPDAAADSLDEAGGDDPAMILFTSGTTGAPKGAVLSHANLLAGSESVGLAWRWTAEDRLVLALPLFHAHGLCVGLHGTLLAGGSAILQDGFRVDAVLDAVDDHDATLFFGVPTMYQRLAASDRVEGLRDLRLCVSGSAPLPAELHERFRERTGQRILERYGMSETLMNVSNPYDGERRPGTVGFPLPGVELRLSATESQLQAEGEGGEVLVRGPNVFGGYWQRPEATSEAFEDGWFHTGDLGARDDEGYLRLLGRARDLIISGGYNVYPREVEDVLLEHPGVDEVAVVGLPSEEWGEQVTAFVVAAGDAPDADDLRDFAAERLARFKRPREVRFVDALPRNALGKVLKHELTE